MTNSNGSHDPRQLLLALWNAAVARVSVNDRFQDELPARGSGRLIVVGAGKAAAAMTAAAARKYGPDVEGIVVTRHGHGLKPGETSGRIKIVEAGHPLPDASGLEAGHAMLEQVRGLSPDDLVVCLLSGGGSALLEDPLPGITFADIKAINARLLESGAPIGEMNCVRKHLSAIKGGGLACVAWPAHVVTLAISDVPGDDPAVIASGPTVGDPTTQANARAVLRRYGIAVPRNVEQALSDPRWESPKPGDARLGRADYLLVATQADALDAATEVARCHGLAVITRGTNVEGEARDIAIVEADLAREIATRSAPSVILGGGELTVTLGTYGSGGANREYALALALALGGHPSVWGLAADTDGIDGTDDGAGAIVTPDTLARARKLEIDPQAALADHDSGAFFSALGDTIVTGPTRTNVSDFRAILVEPHRSA